jgi:glyoxylase-like metal-dependent hydrolase (beta-lactamase superfamily II)
VLEQLKRYVDGVDATIAEIGKIQGEPAKQVAAEAALLKTKAAELKAEQFAPTQTIDADANLEMGGVKVQVHHFGPAHTDNDLAVFLPGLNVLHTGDLLFHGYHAHLDKPGGGSCDGWIATLDKMVAMCNDKTVVVPGYGEPTNVDALKRQASYLAAMKAIVGEQVKVGKAREEVVKMPPPAEYEKYGLVSLYAITLGAMYDELAEKK